ncbi:hypothetical protein BDV24DRAFT_121236 [Aspergillus arachidicola]|uniref:Uncharacterized protein n=1 Tax=Aspergillus arachidicola TaxID=656916 RepID=A0A5N6YTI7_9EURO|nr:hypothetical protein BDV24DRAFT_121236 [Aspergillus arachidicola]
MRSITDFQDSGTFKWDIEASVSPYLSTDQDSLAEGSTLDQQAEVFIGHREKASEWSAERSATYKRVSLSVLNSSNQLFPDYQPHNTNVFSTIDTFESDDGESHLTKATADYFVLGWHADDDDDLLYLKEPEATRRERLDALSFALHGADAADPADEVKEWLESNQSERVLCHGAMYGVRWDYNHKPASVPADTVTSDFQANEPVAIGTTSLDALLAYVRPHQMQDAEDLLACLGPLLRAQSDSIEDRQAAQDEVQNYNFARFAGGSRYVLEIDEQNPAAPPPPQAAALLADLNASQALFDATGRQRQQLGWDLFSLWWKYSTAREAERDRQNDTYVIEVDELRGKILALNDVLQSQGQAIDRQKADILGRFQVALKEATSPAFCQQQDPTIFLGGVKSGWPLDYLDALKVRLGIHIQRDGLPELPPGDDYGFRCLPDTLQDTAELLAREFLLYRKDASKTQHDADHPPPLYHEHGRDRWNDQQPWFPLFLEWEAEYTHVDFTEWEMEERATGTGACKFRYAIQRKPLWDPHIEDRRTITGRILLLPQPVFSLQAQLERLYSSTPEEILNRYSTKDEREQLLEDVIKLPFVSAPLDGFTNHLLTLSDGSHLKPNIRHAGKQPQPLEDAYKHSVTIGIGEEEVRMMGLETDLTPYGSLVRLAHTDAAEGEKYPAFKPVTHGQFKLKKLNVIDKFGQAACVIDPRRTVEGPPPLYPCLGEYYEPQVYCGDDGGTKYPNVVDEPQSASCQFVQVPPSINQPSRLHFNFVTLDSYKNNTFWRPVTEWENPIWGWVMVNYVNYGIQFFLPDGTFYREVRVAAPNNPKGGAQAMDEWLPFDPPEMETPCQLDKLIDQFTDDGNSDEGRKYLLAFMNLVMSATVRAKSVPGAYSQCVNSLVGRPLALANAGLSLELGSDAKRGQSTFEDQESRPIPWTLLPESKDTGHSSRQYQFPVKLGDKDRSYDGLVGYFRALDDPEADNALDPATLYTPYPREDEDAEKFPTEQIQLIGDKNFPRLRAFWLDPAEYSGSDGAAKYMYDRHKHQTAHGFVVDPFSPVNAYSSILPIEPLSLPPWTWESALKSLTAFFHIGPLVVADDVPEFDPNKGLQYDYKLTDEEQTVSGHNIKLPSVAAAEWSWLQPYPNPQKVSDGAVPSATVDDDEDKTPKAYMALDIGSIDPVPTWEKGPLTAVEGFLQMKRSITVSETAT